MSKNAYCEMNAQLLQTSLAERKALEPALQAFEAFRPLTMAGLLLDKETYAYYAAACEYAQSGNVFAQFEMLQFYHAHPSIIASEEAWFLIAKLEKSDAADAHYLLGRCWNLHSARSRHRYSLLGPRGRAWYGTSRAGAEKIA